MKLKIYQETEEKATIDFALQLVKIRSSVVLRAVDLETGEKVENGNLLTIEGGKLTRFLKVNPELGFPLDDFGRIEVD